MSGQMNTRMIYSTMIVEPTKDTEIQYACDTRQMLTMPTIA